MKKLLLSVVAIVTLGVAGNAQNVTIPDANFKAYLVGNTAINTNADTEIQVSEASAFTGQMACWSLNISDLTGIEAFTSLTDLRCFDNSLSNIDVSNNPDLVYLNCQDNLLTELDVSNQADLAYFNCFNNSIEKLDVSNNPALNIFQCYNNELDSLNMASGNNTNMAVFSATGNADLMCIQVDDVAYSTSNWTNIDAQTSFSTDCNACTVTIPDANFKAYLVGNTAINTNGNTEIECSEASSFTGTISCTQLGISDLTGIEAFTALTVLYCNVNSLTSLDISANTSLVDLYANNNQLSSLDVSQNTLLEKLYTSVNPIGMLNVTNNTALKHLFCQQNQLTSLDISQNVLLEQFVPAENQLTTLDLSDNTALKGFNCDYNQLASLDLSNNLALTALNCSHNLITALDVSQNVVLESTVCDNNELTSLNVSNGNNTNYYSFNSTDNANLSCIEVDDAAYSTTNWTDIDAGASFSEDCSGSSEINEIKAMVMNVYPNPASSQITVETDAEIESISIFDVTGALVQKENTTSFSIAKLEKGVYTLSILTNNGLAYSRFIKK